MQLSVDALGRTTTYSYDHNNNVTGTQIAWNDAATGPTLVAARNEYDPQDRLVASISAVNSNDEQRTEIAYDVSAQQRTRLTTPKLTFI